MAPLADQIMYSHRAEMLLQANGSPSSTNPPKKKKSVSFHAKLCKVHHIRPAKDIWYTVEELRTTKAEAGSMAEILELQGLAGSHEEWRGLEIRTEEGIWQSYKARLDVTNAVLDVQDQLQRHQRSLNGAIWLAKASRELSGRSVQQAVERAQNDAVDAKKYYIVLGVQQRDAEHVEGRNNFQAPSSPSKTKNTLLSQRRKTTRLATRHNAPQRD